MAQEASFACAVCLNEEGVYYHEIGDDDSAFAAFQDALESLAAKAGSCSDEIVESAQTYMPSSASPSDEQPNYESGGEGPMLYDRCLSFDQDDANDPAKNAYCCAIVVFNMALVYSKKGAEEDTLHKSIFLYTICLKHLQTKANSNSSLDATEVGIAAMNNQAVVLYLAKEFGMARKRMDELWVHIRRLRRRPQPFLKVLKEDIDCFVQNALLLLHIPSLAAAA